MTTADDLRTMVVAYGDALGGALEPWGPRTGADAGEPQTSGVSFFEGHGVDADPADLVEGDVFVLPEGWSGRWDSSETVRRLYVIAGEASARVTW